MNRVHAHASARSPRVSTHAALRASDTIEWEELPSLFDSVSPRMQPMDLNPQPIASLAAECSLEPFDAWGVTLPASLDAPPAPFCEPMSGLAMREMNEPEVFRHFFG